MTQAQETKEIAARTVHVTKTYGDGDAQINALDDINVEFYKGQFTAIMGPSGSGKSTLLHCLAGLDRVSAGEVWLAETDITRLNEKQLTKTRRERLGFIFQSFNLLPTLNARENIELPIRLTGSKPDTKKLNTIVETLDIKDRLTHKPSELSGGQQQRVAVARALTSSPEIVFADEPTGNLDSKSGTAVLEYMKQAVKEYGQTIIMVTHDSTAASYADRVVFLKDGKILDELENPDAETIYDRLKQLS